MWLHFNFITSLKALALNAITIGGTGGKGFNMVGHTDPSEVLERGGDFIKVE